MHQLLRRAALALTVPLAVGAPVILVAGPAHASADTVNVFLSSEAVVYGQVVTATAEVTDGGNATTDGCVQFQVSLTMEEPVMDVTVPVNSSGTATTPFLKVTATGLPLEINNQAIEHWNVHAVYLADDGGECGAAQVSTEDDVSFDITKASSAVAVVPTATTLSADVTGQFPGAAVETSARPDGGSVSFAVDGAPVGSNPTINGTATINYVVPPGSHTVTASYTGDTHYLPSSSAISKTRKDPILSATLLTTFPKSKSGWYRDAVTIWFSCRPQGSELVGECPGDVTLKKSGKGQSVSRSITALDGGAASITVGDINIDRDKPVIKIKGDTCTATDKLSGVKGKCHMTISSHGTYTAVAVDKAGNRAVKHGKIG